jgi:hypothetical protein
VKTISQLPLEVAGPTTSARSVEAQSAATRLAATIFSFPAMCMFLLVAAIFAFSARAIAEPDIWWHLRNASHLLQYHSLPGVDTYSFTAEGAPSLDFEWLSEVPFLLAFKAMGLQGILAVYFAVLVLIYIGVYCLACRGGTDCKNATVATLLGILLGVVSVGPRMLLFGWLCMVGLLIVLDRFRKTGKGLWILPLLFAVWINFHGSWIFGVVVLVVTIASGLVRGEWGLVVARRWSRVELKKLLLALAASLAALFVNPFGYKLVLYPFDLLFRQKDVMQHLEEWQSVQFTGGTGKLTLIMIVALPAAALFCRRRWRPDELILMAFALWASLSHMRFLFFAGLIAVPILAPCLKLFPPYDRKLDKPWLNGGIMAAIVGSLIFFFPSTAELQQQVSEKYPLAALAFMQQRHLGGRIFNNYGWGGYMEWNAPELKPFIDGRADIFIYNGSFDDYVNANLIQKSFEILDKYRIDYALLEPDQPLSYLLQHSPAWQPIYSDKVAVLFERTPGPKRVEMIPKN